MSNRIDWEASRWRKVPAPLLSRGMQRAFEKDARNLRKRVKKGHKNPQAHLHGSCRILSRDEVAEIAERNGWAVAHSKAEPAATCDDVPWWTEQEIAAGRAGIKR